ncbi:hypothetical protein SAMN05660653_02803 [Desulfonatronum thiosulfatophilum]|uniref:AAA domain-containing protein n=1 Tax=Desulfonatronum thiosulfatophilum TaxID=617002 RepID=A0A1G6EEF4_9BACT|nr:hypothetical protein SAMN05660653_02803 [Desulfonatronum thiosulfatophilum]
MKRHLQSSIREDLAKKMVLITSPRQMGKTHLAKGLMGDFSKKDWVRVNLVQQHEQQLADFLEACIPEDAQTDGICSWP